MRGLGEGGVVPRAEWPRMNQALWRLLLICAAAAAGETIADQLDAYDVKTAVGIAFGAAVYILTQDLDRPGPRRGRRGEIKYWRGRPVDDDDGPRRWN